MEKLAKITNASLSIKDHGILTFYLSVDYEDGFSQGVGGVALDKWDEDSKSRIGTAYGCEIIRKLLLELDVNDFSEMKGKYIWVFGDESGMNFKPRGIRRLNVDIKSGARNSMGVVFDTIK
jgi:hypothetical protein